MDIQAYVGDTSTMSVVAHLLKDRLCMMSQVAAKSSDDSSRTGTKCVGFIMCEQVYSSPDRGYRTIPCFANSSGVARSCDCVCSVESTRVTANPFASSLPSVFLF